MEENLTFGERVKRITERLKEIDDVENKVVFETTDEKGKKTSTFIVHRDVITVEELIRWGKEIGCIE